MRKTMLLAAVALLTSTLTIGDGAALGRRTGAGSPGAATQVTVPADPTGLTVTEITSSSITIAWTDNSGDEDGFKIEKCAGANCSDFQWLANMPAGVTNITEWGLGKNKTYKYRVCAFNSAGDSGYTNTTTATTTR
ncbi:MAG TPA: fibronectin type III domain-containing protein [Pyrinomonadaceae bacterium]|nr:fibronectin type III domain-containing protein [Pyrinomonadaceae bacterium]